MSQEIVRTAEVTLAPTARLEDMIARMVQEGVREELQARGLTLKEISPEVQRRKSLFQKHEAALYYAKWGCLLCRTKKTTHFSVKMCHKCWTRTYQRVVQLEREFNRDHPLENIAAMDQVTRRVRVAERLFGTGQ